MKTLTIVTVNRNDNSPMELFFIGKYSEKTLKREFPNFIKKNSYSENDKVAEFYKYEFENSKKLIPYWIN